MARYKPQEGDIRIYPSKKCRYTNGKWVYIKKPKNEWIKDCKLKDVELIRTLFVEGKTFDEITKLAKCSKSTVSKYCSGLKINFPPVKLPDHIKATKYPNYYISNDGIAYREPRNIDAYGRFGEINQWGLIEIQPFLRGNQKCNDESKMYEGINIYFYDENGKNVGKCNRNIHQLVAESWVPNPHDYNEILHLDENCKNNHYTNLKWGTHKENMQYKHLPEGTVRKKGSSTYIKTNGEWDLIPIYNKRRK